MIPAQHRAKAFWLVALLLLGGSVLVHWKWGADGIGVFGSYASVIGLIVTFYVAESVRSVRDRYTARVTFMQNFESFKTVTGRFEQSIDTNEIRAIAGELEPLIRVLRIPLSEDVRVELLLESLKELMDSRTSRDVQNAKAGVTPLLRQFSQHVKIQRDKDEWRRDHA